jgi:hypothetical protein
MMGPLAPGIAMELIVSFVTGALGDFHDKIQILTEDEFCYEIPLHAYSPSANILFENFVNMGFVPIGKPIVEKILFKNEGVVDGKVKLKWSNLPDIQIEPNGTFFLKSGQVQEVKITYCPRESGILRGIIDVSVEGQTFMKHIDVNATAVEFLKFIIDENGNELNRVDFGEVFFGQKTEFKGFLVNNSPAPFNYRINF